MREKTDRPRRELWDQNDFEDLNSHSSGEPPQFDWFVNRERILEEDRVLYIDTVDRGTFLYTADGVYESRLRLYELEEQLAPREFLRVSKSAIVNFDQVKSLRPDFGGRLLLTMSNGEVVVANRQYVPAIKKKLGL